MRDARPTRAGAGGAHGQPRFHFLELNGTITSHSNVVLLPVEMWDSWDARLMAAYWAWKRQTGERGGSKFPSREARLAPGAVGLGASS